MDDFAARLARALTDTPPPKPLQVAITQAPIFKWRANVIRDGEGRIVNVDFAPTEHLPWDAETEVTP